MVETEARGQTGAMMERMGGEEGIVPERSEWFRSRRGYRKEEFCDGVLEHLSGLGTGALRQSYDALVAHKPAGF